MELSFRGLGVLSGPGECVVGDLFPAVLADRVVGATGELVVFGDGVRFLVMLLSVLAATLVCERGGRVCQVTSTGPCDRPAVGYPGASWRGSGRSQFVRDADA